MIAAAPNEVRETLTKLIPLGRMGRADESGLGYSLPRQGPSSFITGAKLQVDGGMAQV
jgi:NAD(P)-dependent dehydrogenase (short-subunit alcohol dehydrogenase family)